MTDKKETKIFKNKNEYLQYIQSLLDQLSQRGEYVIYLHEMSPDRNVRVKDPRRIIATETTANSIINHGLELDNYGSIGGTARCVGDTKAVKAETIFNYTYPCCHVGAMKAVAIMALPKYIEVDGKKLEYGICSNMERVHELEREAGISPRIDHACRCVYDCIRDWKVYDEKGECIKYTTYLPREYLLGVQEIIEEDSEYRIILPHTHLAELSEKEKQRHLHEAEVQLKKWAEKCGSMDEATMIAKKTIDEYQQWEEREWMNESDW